ncbi:hypothetical protein ACVOMV_24800 [Mesorhizobium atlanticum]
MTMTSWSLCRSSSRHRRSPRSHHHRHHHARAARSPREAGILCNEGAFRLWADVQTPDDAKVFIYRRCGVGSRVDLDYEEEPAAKFRDMVAEYDAWLSAPG